MFTPTYDPFGTEPRCKSKLLLICQMDHKQKLTDFYSYCDLRKLINNFDHSTVASDQGYTVQQLVNSRLNQVDLVEVTMNRGSCDQVQFNNKTVIRGGRLHGI